MTEDTTRSQDLPDQYTPQVVATICGRIAAGESLTAVCKSDGLPSKSSFLRWVNDGVADVADQYARACAARAEGWVEEIVSIADEEGDPQALRLRVDARKWVASKLLPKKYGDKVAVAGLLAAFDPTKLSEDQLRRIADGEDPTGILGSH